MLNVLILAAGYGRRMGPFSRMVNKSLVPYDNKPLISHIIDRFDKSTKFIIACGHMGQQVKDYVSAVHNDKQIIFVDIPDYGESSTGPATTIQHCSPYISGPFFWLACDTLVDFDPTKNLDHNWIGVHPVDSNIAQDYCWVEREGELITAINNKKSSNMAVDAFIGLMYCKDQTYITNLQESSATEAYQGFKENLELRAHTIRKWKDFGTYEKWIELSRDLKEVSFPKPNEIFYHDNGKIIKFTTDSALSERKFKRSQLNEAVMPHGITQSGQFLVYTYVDGDIIYSQLTPELMKKLLSWADTSLWVSKWFPETASVCKDFYVKKTKDRLAQFRVKYSDWSEPSTVNGIEVKTIDEYLEMIDWDYLCTSTEWGFIHGDFQFENIIYDVTTDKFTCIDWRTDFGGDVYGDIYYDLAKMLGGILLDYQAVKADKLEYTEDAQRALLNDCSIPDSEKYAHMIQEYCETAGFDWDKVKLLVPIIYLNMSPLHEAPFDKYLFALAQLHFERYVNERTNSNKQ